MRNAILYLTYNGVYNFTNGIGTQTQLLLTGLEHCLPDLEAEFGQMALHVACPAPDQWTWGYDPRLFRQQQERIAALGGQVHLVPYKAHPQQELWDIHAWRTLSFAVTPWIRQHLEAYDRCLVICIDQPWLHTPRFLAQQYPSLWHRTQTLLVLYNTAYIRNQQSPDAAEIAWEQQGLAFANPGVPVYIADICPSFTTHLTCHFSLTRANFAPYTSSISLDDPAFVRQTTSAVQAVLCQYAIPRQADLVLSFGRAAPIKGFDRLIPALQPLRDRCHFVLISVPYLDDDTEQRHYDRLLAHYGIRATHIKHFTRDLPRALCQWSGTRMVVLPSRQETFSNIPLEVALWARAGGPVVVASKVGGFLDQIDAGKTGFFIDCESRSRASVTLEHVLQLSPTQHVAIRHQAYQRVVSRYDFQQNFPTTLRWLWNAANPAPEYGAAEV
ncbi:D-inositol-3-phosphate glycosyltransferase [Candidatus Entotheonellaceae bacterium PAL068K]